MDANSWPSQVLCPRVGWSLFDVVADLVPDVTLDEDGKPLRAITDDTKEANKRRDIAKGVCAVCPGAELCATRAFTRREPNGVWAGTLPRGRGNYLRRTGQNVPAAVDLLLTALRRRVPREDLPGGSNARAAQERAIALARQRCTANKIPVADLGDSEKASEAA